MLDIDRVYHFLDKLNDSLKPSVEKIAFEYAKKRLNGSVGIAVFEKENDRRLLVAFYENRAKRDKHNREKGLKRLEKRIKSGKLTKENLNCSKWTTDRQN